MVIIMSWRAASVRVREEKGAAVIAGGGEREGEREIQIRLLLPRVLRCRDVALEHRMRIWMIVYSQVSTVVCAWMIVLCMCVRAAMPEISKKNVHVQWFIFQVHWHPREEYPTDGMYLIPFHIIDAFYSVVWFHAFRFNAVVPFMLTIVVTLIGMIVGGRQKILDLPPDQK